MSRLPTCLVQRVECGPDVLRVRLGDPHPIGLDVDAQARHAAEVREGVPTDEEGPVRRFEGHRSDGDAWFHFLDYPAQLPKCGLRRPRQDATIVVAEEVEDDDA